MLDDSNKTADPDQLNSGSMETESSLSDFGRKIFKGDKVIWVVFILLCII